MPGSAELQALVDGGGTVTVNHGEVYTLTEPLLMDANITLVNNGVIQRGYEGASGQKSWSEHALIRNRLFGTRVNNFKCLGTGKFTARQEDGSYLNGKVFSLYGNNVIFNRTKVDGWSGGQACFLAGNDIIMRGVDIRNTLAAVGNGGIRVVGGTGFRAIDCYVESGDDAFQFVPFNNDSGEGVLDDLAIDDGKYIDCTGGSLAARLIAVIIDDAITQNITNVKFINLSGYGSKRVVIIADHESILGDDSEFIQYVLLHNCALSLASGADNTLDGDIYIKKSLDVTLFGGSLSGAVNQWFTLEGGLVGGVNKSQRIKLLNWTFSGMAGNTADRPEPGAVVGRIDDAEVRNCVFTGGKAGGLVALNITANASGTIVTNNNLSGVLYAAGITDNGIGSTLSGNVEP